MKNFTLAVLFLLLTSSISAQDHQLGYTFSGAYKKSILKENLLDASTMKDINSGFPSSWIERYYSVELTATCNGKTMKAAGENDQLTDEQKKILRSADLGTDIFVDIKYNPKSSTSGDNKMREIKFSYTVIPTVEAKFPGGLDVLDAFIKERTVEKLSEETSKKIDLATVRFTVNEDGNAVDAHITTSSGDDQVDKLLLKTICDMPAWKAAISMDGGKVKQEFEISVGNMIGC